MKVIKQINNNAAICIDDNGKELVAFGKGIGFPKIPYEITDLSIISSTYYNINDKYISIIEEIDINIIKVVEKIIQYYKMQYNVSVTTNLPFSLADHINFTIKRLNNNINIDYPLKYEVQHIYENEYEVGLYAVKLFKKELKINLPKDEASSIALHLVNSSNRFMKDEQIKEGLISDIDDEISRYFNLYLDKSSINYARFNTHLNFLIDRIGKNEVIYSSNNDLYEQVITKYKKSYECCINIAEIIKSTLDYSLSNEEKLYLIIHINRLTIRQDCNQK